MKDYMMIFLGADYQSLGLSPEQMQERMGKWVNWSAKLREAGRVKGGHALHNPVRHVSGPSRTVTDRTATEIKDLVGGYFVVSAESLEEATEIAQDFPDYDLDGTVEIREVVVFDNE